MEMLINTSSREALVLWRLCAAHNGTRELIMRRMSRGEEQGGQLLILPPFFPLCGDIMSGDVNIGGAFVCIVGGCIQYMEDMLKQEEWKTLNACAPLVQTDKCLSYTCSQEAISNTAMQFLQDHFPMVAFAILTGGETCSIVSRAHTGLSGYSLRILLLHRPVEAIYSLSPINRRFMLDVLQILLAFDFMLRVCFNCV